MTCQKQDVISKGYMIFICKITGGTIVDESLVLTMRNAQSELSGAVNDLVAPPSTLDVVPYCPFLGLYH